MKFATPYNHDKPRSSNFATVNEQESMTQQTDRDDTDINIIVGRFMKTGQIPTIRADAVYGDFTGARDFRDMLDQVTDAQQKFNELPAEIRQRFHNDPAQFIDFATNKDNLEELRKLKLANPAPLPPEPTLVRVVPEPPKPVPEAKTP